MDEISDKLYQYLCDKVVGSEKVVKYRRQFFRILDDVANSHPIIGDNVIRVSSGSKAEGMDLPGSDYDVMFVFLTWPVYERPMDADISIQMEYLENINALVMETDLAQPGFTLLRIHKNNIWHDDVIINTESGSFLSGRLLKMRLVDVKSLYNLAKLNGPCITNMYDSLDTAFTLKCETWPCVAKEWLSRPRPSGWPSAHLISNICRQGVLFVPIGSKSDSQEDNPLEWRISFSLPEKMLIKSWNHAQFLCYALLKLFTKDVIKKRNNVQKLVCSYFLKTAIFWLSEEQTLHMWTRENLLSCFMLCLKRLVYWYDRNYIPNYFIPQHNMIDRKIPGQSRTELVSLLRAFFSRGWTCLLNCDSLQGFSYFHHVPLTTNNDSQKAIIPLLPLLLGTSLGQDQLPTEQFRLVNSLAQVCNDNLSVIMRSLYLLFFAHLSNSIARKTFYESFQHTNKQHYIQQRQWLSRALMGSNIDSVSGWLLIALFFFINKHYYKTLVILDYVQWSCSIEKQYYSSQTHVSYGEINRRTQSCGKSNIVHNIKSKTMRIFDLRTKPYNGLNTEDYRSIYLIPGNYIILCPPVAFLHFLNFLCYHQLGDSARRQRSLQYLLWIIENDYYIENLWEKCYSSGYLLKAFEIIEDFQSIKHWIPIIRKYQRKTISYIKSLSRI